MQFEQRELKPYAEPASGSSLTVGCVYFSVIYVDDGDGEYAKAIPENRFKRSAAMNCKCSTTPLALTTRPEDLLRSEVD